MALAPQFKLTRYQYSGKEYSASHASMGPSPDIRYRNQLTSEIEHQDDEISNLPVPSSSFEDLFV